MPTCPIIVTQNIWPRSSRPHSPSTYSSIAFPMMRFFRTRIEAVIMAARPPSHRYPVVSVGCFQRKSIRSCMFRFSVISTSHHSWRQGPESRTLLVHSLIILCASEKVLRRSSRDRISERSRSARSRRRCCSSRIAPANRKTVTPTVLTNRMRYRRSLLLACEYL